MMRVCMVVHQDYRVDQRVRRYSEALAALGAEVHVLCPSSQPDRDKEPLNGVRLFINPIRRVAGHPWGYLFEYGATFLWASARLLLLFLRYRYDLIHVHNMPDFLIFTALIPKLFGAKLILDIHDPMPEFYMSKYASGRHGQLLPLLRLQEKLSCGLADEIITANANFRDNLVRRGVPGEKISVVLNVPNPELFKRADRTAGDARTHFTLIYPGTVAPRYGLEVAVRALPLVAKKIPNVRLLVLGAKEQQAVTLRRLAEQLGVVSLLEVRGVVPSEEVVRHIAEADVGIYPALSSPHMDIAMPAKVLEYAVMGIPIVASRLKVLEQLFGESAVMYFEPGSVREFAHCILELYENPARRQELVRRADEAFVCPHPLAEEREKYFVLINRLFAGRRVDLAEQAPQVPQAAFGSAASPAALPAEMSRHANS